VAEQTLFTWDGTTLAEQVHSSGHRTTWNHRPGSSTPVTQAEQDSIDERFYAIVTDIVGTPTELVDAAGNLAWRQNTTLWGAVLAPLQQDAYCPIRFPGQYHDLETGHHYNLYRHYDPEVGRYLSADPLGLAPAPNPRSYVGNPLLWADPVGLAPYRVFYSVQDEADARRLVENGGEPWPTGTSHGSARAEFGPGLYTWETREDAEKYLAGQQAKGADVSILEHRISEEDYGRLKSADLTKMDDDTATDIWNSGGNHGYDHVRRMTGRYGVENYFRAGVYGHFHTRRAT
jgi:RHS repeat-associated protein